MARKPRIEFEGAFYHVITRGNQRQRIFKDRKDFLKYLEVLSHYKLRYKFILYCYALMKTHVHLLLETRETPLSKIFQGVNQSYTMYFNKRYKTVGHLFQGRYKAILCDRDEYLLSLVKYIHLNPVRAGITKSAEEYEWSSHIRYAKKIDKNELTDVDTVLQMFSEKKHLARKYYRSFIGDGVGVRKEDVYSTIDQRILGREEFVDKVREQYDGTITKEKIRKAYNFSQIGRAVEKRYGISVNQMRVRDKSRPSSLAKKVFSITADGYGYKGKEIAGYLDKDPSVITRYLKEKNKLRRDIEKIDAVLELNVNKQV